MQKVLFTYKTGRERMMSKRDAELLTRLRRGTYMTRDMGAVAPSSVVLVNLDALDAEALHTLAKERGIKVHHKAGADKIRSVIREALE